MVQVEQISHIVTEDEMLTEGLKIGNFTEAQIDRCSIKTNKERFNDYISEDDLQYNDLAQTMDFENELTVGKYTLVKKDDYIIDGFDYVDDTADDQKLNQYGGLPVSLGYCSYTVTTYPCNEYGDHGDHADHVDHADQGGHRRRGIISNEPRDYTLIITSLFIFTALIFIGYDKLVAMRQRKVMQTAIQSTTIVSSLFPSSIRDRLMEEGNPAKPSAHALGDGNSSSSMHQPTKSMLRSYLNGGVGPGDDTKKARPIADLFTETTVLFADIAGFTAWSSAREPAQVFTLLETVYGAFDTIAARRGVFKVEVRIRLFGVKLY
jgi:hypothetical protein